MEYAGGIFNIRGTFAKPLNLSFWSEHWEKALFLTVLAGGKKFVI
jgi:hypothetical protein